MADNGMMAFFQKSFAAIGIDIALLLTILFTGLFLSMIYAGAGDDKTTEFALIYSFSAFVCLVVAGAARLSNGKFFRGADYAIVEEISPRKHPVLGLLYLIIGTVMGFAIVAGKTGFFANLLTKASSFSPQGFIFQDMFSPVVEEYLFRGFLQPLLEMFFILRFGESFLVQLIAWSIAAVLQGLSFAFVHLVAFNGNVDQLLTSLAFGIAMAAFSRVFGLMPAIGLHAGHNLGISIGS